MATQKEIKTFVDPEGRKFQVGFKPTQEAPESDSEVLLALLHSEGVPFSQVVAINKEEFATLIEFVPEPPKSEEPAGDAPDTSAAAAETTTEELKASEEKAQGSEAADAS